LPLEPQEALFITRFEKLVYQSGGCDEAYRQALLARGQAKSEGNVAFAGAAIADSKGEGLRRHYGADETATKFWDVHGTLEADHATWTMDGLASLNGDAQVISLGARRIADSWWNFLTEREELAAA
jgi:hypothetical protein